MTETSPIFVHDLVLPPQTAESLLVQQYSQERVLEEPETRVVERRSQFPSKFPPRCMTGVIGRSEGLLDVFRVIDRVADTNCTVLITGESGTGKELVARAVHESSHRVHAPFVAVNCGAIP